MFSLVAPFFFDEDSWIVTPSHIQNNGFQENVRLSKCATARIISGRFGFLKPDDQFRGACLIIGWFSGSTSIPTLSAMAQLMT